MLQQIALGQRVTITSFGANVVIGVLEVYFGTYLGSLALSADGIHSFVDALVSLTVWLGIIFSVRRADGRFHYGYYRFDAIFSLFAAIIMVVSGIYISYTADKLPQWDCGPSGLFLGRRYCGHFNRNCRCARDSKKVLCR